MGRKTKYSKLILQDEINAYDDDCYEDEVDNYEGDEENDVDEGLPEQTSYTSITQQHLDNENFHCIICLLDWEIGRLVVECSCCRNVFHHHCIMKWMEQKPACPLCRAELTPRQEVQRICPRPWRQLLTFRHLLLPLMSSRQCGFQCGFVYIFLN